MKTAILGGSFDPVHIGHIVPIIYLLNEKIVDDVIIIPCMEHPLNKNIYSPFEIRLKMLELVFGDFDNVKVCDIENHLQTPSYTYNTVIEIKKTVKSDLYFIIGYDEAHVIDKWYKYTELKNMINFILIKRSGKDYKICRDYFVDSILCDNPIIDVSSTMIRNLVKKGKEYRYLVPDCIVDIIKKNNLYIE